MSPSVYLGAAGFGLIAVCYGFARFAFGLFLPQIDTDLALTPTLSGFISGGSFLGYCLAIILSAYLTERIGARAVPLGRHWSRQSAWQASPRRPPHYCSPARSCWLAQAPGWPLRPWRQRWPLPCDVIGKVPPTRSLMPERVPVWCFQGRSRY